MTDSHDTVVSDVRASVSTPALVGGRVIGNWDSYAAAAPRPRQLRGLP